MKGYKGFNKDFKCNDKQFEVGKEFSTDGKLELCENGLHFCKFPLDVIRHYGFTTSRFATVESIGMVKDDNPYNISEKDTKVCTNKLKICSEIGISGLIDATIESIKDNIDTSIKCQKILDPQNNINEDASVSANTCNNSTATNDSDSSIASNTGNNSIAIGTGSGSISVNTGRKSAATNVGDSSIAGNTGLGSVSTNAGYCSIAANVGYCSVATNKSESSIASNTGFRSAAINDGYASAAINTGDSSLSSNTDNLSIAANTGNRSMVTNKGTRSMAINTGNNSIASNKGCNSIAANTGHYSAAVVTGKNSVAISTGYNSIAKGALDNWIVLAEWSEDKSKKGAHVLKDIQCFKVDGIKILPNIFYRLEDGNPVIEDFNENIKNFVEPETKEE